MPGRELDATVTSDRNFAMTVFPARGTMTEQRQRRTNVWYSHLNSRIGAFALGSDACSKLSAIRERIHNGISVVILRTV